MKKYLFIGALALSIFGLNIGSVNQAQAGISSHHSSELISTFGIPSHH